MTSATEEYPKSLVLRCAWLLNPHEAPRQNVRVTVVDGVVEEIADLPADERSQAEPVALLPRFVNAHTHLEFSALQQPVKPSSPFPDWIRSVIRYRMDNPSPEFTSESITSGMKESSQAGVGLIGEITTSDTGQTSLESDQTNVVSFREFIGFRSDAIGPQLEVADNLTVAPGSNATLGLSPHAPYSVHPELFEGLIDTAVKRDLPVAMHLAETRDEIELLQNRSGRFVDFLQSMNLWEDSTLGTIRSVMPYLQKLATCKHALAIHCNYLSAKEMQFLSDNTNIAVTYCPRTHHWFGHTSHPFSALLQAGANVILGTDSRASNPDLSIWRELQHVANLPNSPALWEMLHMITDSAAAALGKPSSDHMIIEGRHFAAVAVDCKCDSISTLNQTLIGSCCQPVKVYRPNHSAN